MRFELVIVLVLLVFAAILLVRSRLLRAIVGDTLRHPSRAATFVAEGDEIRIIPEGQEVAPTHERTTSHASFAYLLVPLAPGSLLDLPPLTLSRSAGQRIEVVAAHNGKGV
jgi:hypothetical protein